jgi:hypothetical protein
MALHHTLTTTALGVKSTAAKTGHDTEDTHLFLNRTVHPPLRQRLSHGLHTDHALAPTAPANARVNSPPLQVYRYVALHMGHSHVYYIYTCSIWQHCAAISSSDAPQPSGGLFQKSTHHCPQLQLPSPMRFAASIRLFVRAAAARVSRTASTFAASPAPRRVAFAASAAAGFFASSSLFALV